MDNKLKIQKNKTLVDEIRDISQTDVIMQKVAAEHLWTAVNALESYLSWKSYKRGFGVKTTSEEKVEVIYEKLQELYFEED